MHLLLLTIPQTHVMCIMGLMVSRLEWAVIAKAHLVQTFLAESTDKVGHLSHMVAEGVSKHVCETLLQHFVTLYGKVELYSNTTVY